MEVRGGQRKLTTDDQVDVSDRSARAIGKVGVQVAGADVALANAVPVTVTDGAGNPNAAAHPTFTDVVDRAARAAGKVGLQVGGADVTNANPVPHSITDGAGNLNSSAHPTFVDPIDRAARLAGKVGIQVAGADVGPANPVNVSSSISKVTGTGVASAARTTTGDSTGSPIDISTTRGLVVVLNISAVSGTAPTLVLDILTKDPVSGNWGRINGFSSQNAVGTLAISLQGPTGTQVAFRWTIGGTVPSFTFSVGTITET